MKKYDKYLYVTIASASIAILLAAYLLQWKPWRGNGSGLNGAVLEVSYDGNIVDRIDMSEVYAKTSLELHGGGGSNLLEIGPDGVRMASADCPGGDCLRMAPLVSTTGAIVCLPHKLTVRLRMANDGNTLDAVTH